MPPAATNDLQLALASFDTLVKKFPQSPLFGKAQLDLGWCYWREGRLPEAQAAFQAAVERLPLSKDQATAYFWLADAQFQQTNFAGAIKSYQAIIEKFAALPEVRTNLFEPALYQTCARRAGGGRPGGRNQCHAEPAGLVSQELECRPRRAADGTGNQPPG